MICEDCKRVNATHESAHKRMINGEHKIMYVCADCASIIACEDNKTLNSQDAIEKDFSVMGDEE